ncbi:MAG: hypothetical protein FRX49_03522, partial [Trebouxia sp. A1-2]
MSSDACRQKGNAAFSRNDYASAITQYTLALAEADKAGDRQKLFSNRSAAHLQLSAYTDALEDAEAALQIDPRFTKALFRKALALEALSQTEQALQMMLLAQHQEPQDKQIQKTIHRLRKASANKTSGAATSLQQPVSLETTEAPEDVHRRKHIKLQPGWLYHASPDGIDENLLILLHGYGDTPEPYAKLARQMALPQTACLALPGPIGPVPGTPNGRAWYNEEDEDESLTGQNSSSNSVTSTFQWLQQVLAGLQGSDGWPASNTHLFGFSQGGSAALHLALHCRGEAKLGSCVAVAAALLPQQLRGLTELQQQSVAGSTTPVLLTHGSKHTEVLLSRAQATAAAATR